MLNFIKWIGNSVIVNSKRQTIAGTMSITTYTLNDNRVFVVADNVLISYDGGFYETLTKGSDMYKWCWDFGCVG